jgi:hypothetical protein
LVDNVDDPQVCVDRLGRPHRVPDGTEAVLRSIHTNQDSGSLCDPIQIVVAHTSTILRSTLAVNPSVDRN